LSLLAVIGKPVQHSLSPYLHHYCASLMGLRVLSFKCELEANQLTNFVGWVRTTPGFVGFNVTMPYKSQIMGLLDGVDNTAKKLLAINTVVKMNGELKGYNTDWIALRQAVASRGGGFDSALILGAGGAAAAAIYGLLNPEPLVGKVYVYGRSRDRLDSLKSTFPNILEYNGGREYGLLINATPLPPGQVITDPIKAQIIIDFPYSYYSHETSNNYSRMGVTYVDGIELLARQGVEAMKLFFGGHVDYTPVYHYIKRVHILNTTASGVWAK